MTRGLSAAVLAALVATALPHAAGAQGLGQEWRSFRTYPRLERAVRLLEQGDAATARPLVEQAIAIDPANRQARLLLFQLCATLGDIACVERNGREWRLKAPADAAGYAMGAWAAWVQRRDADVLAWATDALARQGLAPEQRATLLQRALAAALRLGRLPDARALLAGAGPALGDDARRDWEQRIADAGTRPAPPRLALPAPRPASAATTAAAPARTPRRAAASTSPSTSTPARGPSRPAAASRAAPAASAPVDAEDSADVDEAGDDDDVAELSPEAVARRLEDSFEHLVDLGRSAQAVRLLRDADRLGLLTRPAREQAVVALQPVDCEGVVDLVATDETDERTSHLLQMTAGYCAGHLRQHARAARHFARAAALAGDDGARAAALVGEGQALADAGDPAVALQRWQAALALRDDADLRRRAASMARLAASRPASGASPDELLAIALRLDPANAETQAAAGYAAKARGRDAEALDRFETAHRLDPQRSELLAEMALLAERLDRREDAIRHGRAAIDASDAIGLRLGRSADAQAEQRYAWRRQVQQQEDRFGVVAGVTVRLDDGPRAATSAVDEAGYGGVASVEASWRGTPFGGATPSWAFVRGAQGLDDRSLAAQDDNALLGIGVRQRLAAPVVLFGSAEVLLRSDRKPDLMLRLSGSHTVRGDWQPTVHAWNSVDVYADLARLVRSRATYATLAATAGRTFKFSGERSKWGWMPYVSTTLAAHDDNAARQTVSRLDVGLGLALRTWQHEDPWRAPAVSSRLSLEYRQAIAGNARDRSAWQLRWLLQH